MWGSMGQSGIGRKVEFRRSARRSSGRMAGRVLLLLFGLGLGLVMFASLGPAEREQAFAPQRAPVNPEFLRYLEDLKLGRSRDRADDGHWLGEIPAPVDLSHVRGFRFAAQAEAFPASYDLRTLGKLTSVKDQGDCGSCWSFATMGGLESYLLPPETWDFAEQNLIDHAGFDYGPCAGGNIWMSTAYLSRWTGPIKEVDDPYIYSDLAGETQKHVQNVIFLPNRTAYTDNDAIKQAIMTYGAFYISMYWASGSYSAADYAYYYTGGTSTNHGICVVGWDDNFDRTKFNPDAPANGAFICKNSWGSTWGQSGYFYLSYYDTSFRPGAIFTAEPSANYTSVYQYDPLGWVINWGLGTDTAWGANIFQAVSSESLGAVATYASVPNTAYSIYIYTNVTAGNPTSGTLAATQSGTFSSTGYFTVPLGGPVALTSGQLFSVIVRYQTPGFNWPLPTEDYYDGYSSGATSNAGESFFSNNGSTWMDAYTLGDLTNLCIKAFTAPAVAPVTISGTVRTASGTGVSGVTLNGLPSNPITPGTGAYSEVVSNGWSGTVVPSGAAYTFSPASRDYASVMANRTAQDYTAGTGGCTYTLSATALDFAKTGGTGSVGITAGIGCAWTATSAAAWVQITLGSSGSGNGTVTLNVDPNTGTAARTGLLTVAGQSVAIHQAGDYEFNGSSSYVVLPEVIWAEATGGGAWVTEVQITDVSGSSAVDAYFDYGGGLRRGPITVWTNTSGPRRSVKFTNFLAFLGTIDTGFAYYGRVGAVEFVAQDPYDRIQAAARTVNGNYAKTFPGLLLADENLAVPARPTMIQNLASNSSYRSSCGFFNPTANSVTAEFRLFSGGGAQIGSTISRTFVGHDFQSFNPFNQAGVPYPGSSYDNVYLVVAPTSGTGALLGYGATANNTSNDPAAHLVVQSAGTEENSPAADIILPEVIWAEATGGGTWVSEVQVTDLAGGSAVSVYFAPPGGTRRGPFTVWTNGGGSGGSVKFTNFLSTLAGLDPSFTYYGKVGAVEFLTQDVSHKVQVAARTLNGNYSKTFPGLQPTEGNTTASTHDLLIQNLTNNATYRSTCGFYNPTASSVTVAFRLYDGNGAQIGSTFSRTFVGYDFQSFNPFTQAGVPYPGSSYDNTILLVVPTSGTGKVIGFGASANNTSADPAAHIVVKFEHD